MINTFVGGGGGGGGASIELSLGIEEVSGFGINIRVCHPVVIVIVFLPRSPGPVRLTLPCHLLSLTRYLLLSLPFQQPKATKPRLLSHSIPIYLPKVYISVD
ncbi:unnamed protein product [Cuscuta europaea]|uniref:Uncharacterized protein n=1 Tax=Cuscuta europaea TaxID=41803 RepID=A0A9P0Z3G2_CUSEU|nr:unnamed protein product [Cuscuta europaea]